jgi:hypothetical protein
MNNVLFLTLKKEPFEQIKAGIKTSEYRDYKPYWIKRLMNEPGSFKNYDAVLFQNGYSKDAPRMLVELKSIQIVRERNGIFRWKKYFELRLGKLLDG